MRNFSQSIVSKRFLQIVDQLIDQEKIKNDSAFCKAVGFAIPSFSQIRKGKRDVTIDLISKLVKVYHGNPTFLFSGDGQMFLSDDTVKPVSYSARVANDQIIATEGDIVGELRTEVEWRKKLLEQYFKQGELNINYTKVLEEQNKELLRELGRSVKK